LLFYLGSVWALKGVLLFSCAVWDTHGGLLGCFATFSAFQGVPRGRYICSYTYVFTNERFVYDGQIALLALLGVVERRSRACSSSKSCKKTCCVLSQSEAALERDMRKRSMSSDGSNAVKVSKGQAFHLPGSRIVQNLSSVR
jgi:hypothetical protein